LESARSILVQHAWEDAVAALQKGDETALIQLVKDADTDDLRVIIVSLLHERRTAAPAPPPNTQQEAISAALRADRDNAKQHLAESQRKLQQLETGFTTLQMSYAKSQNADAALREAIRQLVKVL